MAEDQRPMARSIDMMINCPFSEAYAFTKQPENFALWAAGMASSLHFEDEAWHAKTPAGDAVVTFSRPNAFGILDHRVDIAGKAEIYIPLRMIKNGDVTHVVFTLLRQPGMDDAAFEEDAKAVEKDLLALKALLERKPD